MRFAIAVVLLAGMGLYDSAHAQGTVSPSVAPKVPQAPVGHRQPRPSDIPTTRPGTEPQSMAQPSDPVRPDPQDERMNRILNGICRGC